MCAITDERITKSRSILVVNLHPYDEKLHSQKIKCQGQETSTYEVQTQLHRWPHWPHIIGY